MSETMSLTTSVVGVGESVKGIISLPKRSVVRHAVRFTIIPTGPIKVSAAKIQIQGSPDDSGAPSTTNEDEEGAVVSPALAVGSTPEKIANGAFPFRFQGANYNKAADAVGVVFSAVHKVAANKFGAINVYVDVTGSISTKIDSAAQTDTLSHNTAALALTEALASDFPHPANNLKIGTILIQNNGDLWTANTDDLTNGSDLTTATFFNSVSSFVLLNEYTLTANDISMQKGVYYVADIPDRYNRLFLSEITGDGQFVITSDNHITNLPG